MRVFFPGIRQFNDPKSPHINDFIYATKAWRLLRNAERILDEIGSAKWTDLWRVCGWNRSPVYGMQRSPIAVHYDDREFLIHVDDVLTASEACEDLRDGIELAVKALLKDNIRTQYRRSETGTGHDLKRIMGLLLTKSGDLYPAIIGAICESRFVSQRIAESAPEFGGDGVKHLNDRDAKRFLSRLYLGHDPHINSDPSARLLDNAFGPAAGLDRKEGLRKSVFYGDSLMPYAENRFRVYLALGKELLRVWRACREDGLEEHMRVMEDSWVGLSEVKAS